MVNNLILEVSPKVEDQFNWLRPRKPFTYDRDSGKYVLYNNVDAISEYSVKGNKAIEAYKQIISCCKNVSSNVYSLCYYLKRFFENFGYIQSSILPEHNDKPRESYPLRDDEFFRLLEEVGISKSTFYRYKDVGEYVDINNGCLISDLSGYSFSLVCEMISLDRIIYDYYHSDGILRLIKIIPSSTTIEQITKYKKIISLRIKCKPPFNWSSDPDSMYQKIKTGIPLPDVLKIWQEWEQGQANKQLEDTMSGKADNLDPTPEFDETIKSLREEIDKLKLGYVPELGMCEGCKFKGINLNKCRSCRRYKDMKDLYEGV